MSLRKRILRTLLLLALVVGFVGYFAFSTFLFAPFESDFEADVATLAPRDVDFFVARAGLADEFSDFPRLAVAEALEATSGWQRLVRSPEYVEWSAEAGIDQALQQLRDLKEQLRGVEPLDVIGGEDIALAGYFRGPDMQAADWAVYGRANWLGKLGVALLGYPGLIGLEQQGLTAVEEEGCVALTGPNLPRPMYVTRVQDVVVLGPSRELVVGAGELAARRGEDSFGLSARYYDYIEQVERSRERDELEVFVDMRALAENKRLSGRWPDAQSEDWLPAFAGRLFQLGAVREWAGIAGVDGGISLDVHADLSSELVTPEQQRVYRTRGFERAELVENASQLAPSDVSWFLFAHLDIGEVMRQSIAALEDSTRELIDDRLRATREFNDVGELIQKLEGIFRDRFAIVVRDNDYKYDAEQDPPSDGAPVAAVSLVFWLQGRDSGEQVKRLEQVFIGHQAQFGIQGREPGSRGVFKNTVSSGFEVTEFWNRNLPGTGHLATVHAGEVYIVSNSFRMLEHVLQTFSSGPPNYPRLTDRSDFRALTNSSLPQANLGLWVDPRALAPLLRKQARVVAEDAVAASIDWRTERARVETEVLREKFPGERRGQVDADTQQEVDVLVDARLGAMRQKIVDEQVPAARARMERKIVYTEMASAVLGMLALDPKAMDLTLRVVVPLDEEVEP